VRGGEGEKGGEEGGRGGEREGKGREEKRRKGRKRGEGKGKGGEGEDGLCLHRRFLLAPGLHYTLCFKTCSCVFRSPPRKFE